MELNFIFMYYLINKNFDFSILIRNFVDKENLIILVEGLGFQYEEHCYPRIHLHLSKIE